MAKQLDIQSASEPIPSDPIEEIVKAFDRFPIVALGEAHYLQEEADFIAQLIQHPDFSAKVNDIVVEFGNALYQDVIDRYIAGEDVPRKEVQQVWRNTTQFFIWDSAVYERFFANVRAVNQSLPASGRLRVLLGDPPIDWSKVQRREDWEAFMSRDYDVKVVENEVLSKNRKALYIKGAWHILEESGILSLEQKYHQSIFIISPHLMCFHEKSAELEQRLASWPKPSLALVKGTWLGEMDGSLTIGVLNKKSKGDEPYSPYKGRKLEDLVDAFLYLGPLDSLTGCGAPPDTYDEDYVNELNRRWRLIEGQELSPEFFTSRTSNSWRYIEPFQELLGNFRLS